ncbi:hypothetical protein BHE74_00030140 [Ensete ventricosum]|nr:hypothetical protein BHE74_00030140 [Ensete ventricosum]RZS10083.1 hypothetical protein BHM03_00041244 [Ensete ventricosum]
MKVNNDREKNGTTADRSRALSPENTKRRRRRPVALGLHRGDQPDRGLNSARIRSRLPKRPNCKAFHCPPITLVENKHLVSFPSLHSFRPYSISISIGIGIGIGIGGITG